MAVVLRSTGGEVLDAWRPPDFGNEGLGVHCRQRVAAEKNKFAIHQDCEVQVLGGGAYCAKSVSGAFDVTIDVAKKRLQTSAHRTKETPAECGGE